MKDGSPTIYDCCPGGPESCEVSCTTIIEDRPPRITIHPHMVEVEKRSEGFSDLLHVAPKIPVVVDRVTYLPQEISRFNGRPLHFLMCRSTVAQSAIYAFSSKAEMIEKARDCSLRNPLFNIRDVPQKAGSGVVFYDQERWGGSSYFLPAGLLFHLNATWWDDRLSSIRGFGTGTFVTLLESADRGGSSLTLATDLGWADLGIFGWKDRVSSILVWPVEETATKVLESADGARTLP